MTNPSRIAGPGRPSTLKVLAVSVPLSLAWMAMACASKSTITVVIDTDMAVPLELDGFALSVVGPTQALGPYAANLRTPEEPPFPRTLTLVDKGSASAVTITVEGLRDGTVALTTKVKTQFVAEQTRMLRIVLTAACLGVPCDPATQTCDGGKCVPLERPGASLRGWSGDPPPRPMPLAGEEKLLWSAGWRSCAPAGGTLYCWGENSHGQIGNPSSTSVPVSSRLPVVGLVPQPTPSTSVGLGYKHSCVCDSTTGLAYCWGNNDHGQVGPDADAPFQATPRAVRGITDCKLIASGAAHTCVVRNDPLSSVACWGRNSEGQAGPPGGASLVGIPQPVPGVTKIQEIKAGEHFTCALGTNGGAIYCWGENVRGQLGDGTLNQRNTPNRVNLPGSAPGTFTSATELALGRYFACALTENQTVYCWGENTDGMVGVGVDPITTPVPKPSIDDAVRIVAGHKHACVLRASKVISCWGSGEFGQLGDSFRFMSTAPVNVVDITGATALAAGIVHTCARTQTGVFCWGQSSLGQLGNSSFMHSPTPVRVIGF